MAKENDTATVNHYEELFEHVASIKEPTSAHRQYLRAHQLEAEKQRLQKAIGANREYLRLMDANEELPEELGAWLDDFYGTKSKGEARTADEIKRGREAREVATNRF